MQFSKSNVFSWTWLGLRLLRTMFMTGFSISSLFPNHHSILKHQIPGTYGISHHLINPRFPALLPPRHPDTRECETSSAGYYFTQLANSQRFSLPLRSLAEHRTGESTNYSMPRQTRVTQRTADSRLPHKITSRSKKLSPPYESPKEPKEQAKKPRTIFSADPDVKICIRIRIYRLAGEEAADFSHCFGSDANHA